MIELHAHKLILFNRTETEMVDQILSQEEQTFDALLSLIRGQQGEEKENTGSDYGSDDDDYDQLFMEVMCKERTTEGQAEGGESSAIEYDAEMDTS